MTGPASSPPAGSGELRLDLDLAQEAVSELEAVRESLVVLKQDAHEVARQAATGIAAHDLVSVEASQLLAAKADGAPGSLGLALDAGIRHVEALIGQLRRDIEGQRLVDEQAAVDLRAS